MASQTDSHQECCQIFKIGGGTFKASISYRVQVTHVYFSHLFSP